MARGPNLRGRSPSACSSPARRFATPYVQLCGGAYLNGEAVAREVTATIA